MPRMRVEGVSFPKSFDPVRIGDLDFAREFVAHLSRGYELDIEIIDGSPKCVGIRNPSGITNAHGLRDDLGNLGELVRTAASYASNPAGDKRLRSLRRSDVEHARRAVRRRRYGDDYHRTVLETVAEAKALGERQDFYVADRLKLGSSETARSHIRRARQALGQQL